MLKLAVFQVGITASTIIRRRAARAAAHLLPLFLLVARLLVIPRVFAPLAVALFALATAVTAPTTRSFVVAALATSRPPSRGP